MCCGVAVGVVVGGVVRGVVGVLKTKTLNPKPYTNKP